MIIGISGKIGSGKDTVGQIIQYLVWNQEHHVPDITIMDFLVKGVEDYYEADVVGDIDYTISEASGWKVKKWADKLKDIVCILLGCTREQLEDREFKEGQLGEEWDKWLLQVEVGDTDDTFYFNTEEGAKAYLEKNYAEYPNFSHQGNYEGKITHWGFTITKETMTPRLLLQILGTDCGRDIIHPNIWINSLMADYKWDGHSMTDGWVPSYSNPDNSGFDEPAEPIMPNWLITDTRFPNEAEAVLEKGGVLIRVNRGDGNTGSHSSETALDNYDKWSEVIDNNGTMEELIEKVRQILLARKILKEQTVTNK